ncbi:MAG TPA: hypothetical protein VL475_14780, partial [Planctomycetaceae bacterium]|nr:hypothetical protein [Planctomycetaceae bacterium]
QDGPVQGDCRMSRSSISGCFFGTVVTGALVAIGSGNGVRADDASRPAAGAVTAAPQNADSVQDLLFCTSRRPLLIRLHLFVRGAAFRSLRGTWADAQFALLDTDKSGSLEGAELKRIPAPQSLQIEGAIDRGGLPPVDSQPADGKVSPAEFRGYVLAASGTPFSIEQAQESANTEVDLFPLLDQDRDGKLSADELRTAPARLQQYDRDEDDVLEIQELQQALPGEQVTARRELVGALSLIVVVDPARGSAVARRLIEGYDKASRDPIAKTFRKDEQLSLAELAIAPAEFARADRNGDGRLDRSELAGLAAVMDPAVELEIHAPAADGTFMIKLLRRPAAEIAALIDVEQPAKGQYRLKLEGTPLELRAEASPAGLENQIRERYIANFGQVDRDNNEHVDSTESQRFGAQFAPFFKQADTDGDGKVDMAEYVAQLDRELALTKCRVNMKVSSDGRSLFRLIDADGVGRLSARELREALAKSSKWDTDGDQSLSREELAVQLQATFSAGTPRVNGPFSGVPRPAPAVQRERPVADLPPAGAPVPSWFTKMDRNRDGDVTPKEFLGSRTLFDKYDRNRDGLITAQEAIEAAKAAAEKR